jgi:tetratricopeptide (TPR) repeat protein
MVKKYSILISIILLFNTYAQAAGEVSVSDSAYKKGKDDQTYLIAKNSSYKKGLNAIKQAKKYEKKGKVDKSKKRFNDALKFFTLANEKNPGEPNILNYLGFTSRKIGDFAMAEIYYEQGLEIDPLHNGINEYLGELYVQTNRIDKAKERLKVLENCNCDEFEELKAAIKKGSSKY